MTVIRGGWGTGVRYLCVYCGHRSESEAESRRHRRTHPHEERIAVCPFCDKEFYNNGQAFITHQRVHEAEETEAFRFWRRVEQDDETGCWTWTASERHGYGRFSYAGGQNVFAHRYAYELLEGPVPDGLELDHLCFNPICVNPGHLEPVTRSENSRRMHARPGNYVKCPVCPLVTNRGNMHRHVRSKHPEKEHALVATGKAEAE